MAGRRKKTARATWPRRDYLEDALAQYEANAAAAAKAGSWSAVAKLKQLAVGIRSEIDQLDESARVMALPDNLDDHRLEVLQQVRKLRAAAEASNSFVAASTLLKLEAEMVREERDRLKALAEKTKERTAAQVLAEVQKKLEALPDRLRQQLEAALPR